MSTAAALATGVGVMPAGTAWAAPAATRPVVQAPGRPADSTGSTGDTICAPGGQNGAATTCTGTFGGETGWDWSADGGVGAQSGLTPTATVSQTSNLTNQVVDVSWTGFTPALIFPDDNPANGFSPGQTAYAIAVFQCAGTTPQDLATDCNEAFADTGTSTSGAEPTAVEGYAQSGTSQEFTDCTSVPGDPVCGSGSTSIQVQTSVQNSALGCDAAHACSIVVEPLWGGNSYGLQNGEPDACDDHSLDLPPDDYAMDGNDGFYNPCAWMDRIVIPIAFSPTPSQYCPTSGYQFTAEGSPALEREMEQWQPSWCTSGQNKVDFDFDSGVNEYQARSDFLSGNSALTAATDVALVTDPPAADAVTSSSRQFTYAPVSNTGIVVAYYVDDPQTSEPVTDIVLDARLVAKLLTESYSLDFNQCTAGQTTQSDDCDPGVANNPRDIFEDPEFLKLNPGHGYDYTDAGTTGDFLPIVTAGNSDITYELTRWVESDPDARAFLEGRPDPWGMHVNTYYETGQHFPISQFQVLDPGYTLTDLSKLSTPGYNGYNVTMQVAWNPVTGLDTVARQLATWTGTALQFNPQCNDPEAPQPPCSPGFSANNPKAKPQLFSKRGLFAVMDQGTADALQFPTAELVNPAGNPEGPTGPAESAALSSMQTNPDKITQYQNFAATSPNAYPLTEVQYAMVPTCGLSAPVAQSVSSFLHDVIGSQYYGTQVGQIPPFGGYLTLDDAQEAQTTTAAQQVASQTCATAPPDTTVSGTKPPATTGTGSNTGTGTGAVGPIAPVPTTPTTGAATTAATPSSVATPDIEPVALGEKSPDSSGAAHMLLPIALILGALLLLGGPLTYALGTGALRLPTRAGAGPASPPAGDGSAAGPQPDVSAPAQSPEPPPGGFDD
ncbi:MAG TPA: hypothetical protein VGX23_14515 [Actinocrinis sp.]|nr:hypothetical protein [Actinocrinis sp.]